MVKKLIPMEEGYGIVIDKAILELLGIDPTEDVKLRTDGRTLIIEAPDSTNRQPKEKTKSRFAKVPTRGIGRDTGRGQDGEARYGFPKKQPW